MNERKTYIEEGVAGGRADQGNAPITRREGDALAAELAYQRDMLRRACLLARDMAVAMAEPDSMHDYGDIVVRAEALVAVLSDRRG